MEMKVGYKQTEVGLIPEDWEVVNLGAVARGINRGASPRPIDDPRWFDEASNIGWVRISDVTQSGRYLTETTQRLSQDGVRHSRYVPSGALIMSICATVGRPVETRIDTCIHDGFVLFDRPQVEQGFLYHVLKELEPRWSSKGQTGSQMNLNTGLIKGTRIPLPPTKAEQEAIAESLSNVDVLIESLERLLVKKRHLKQGAMQQLLTGQTHLPGFHEEWEVKRIGDLIEAIGDGGTPSTANPHNFGGAINWVVIDDIRDEITTTATTLTDRGLRSCAAKLWKPGTLIVSTGATIGEVGIARIPVATKQGICGIFVNQAKANTSFLKYWFVQNKSLLMSKAQGSTIKEVRAPTLVQFEISTPPVSEQTAIATILIDMDAELMVLEAYRNKTHEIKQGMMQKLLTGRIRLK